MSSNDYFLTTAMQRFIIFPWMPIPDSCSIIVYQVLPGCAGIRIKITAVASTTVARAEQLYYRRAMIDQKTLKQLLHYDLDTGAFTWLVATGRRSSVGSVAGFDDHGYIRIGIEGKTYFAHRLAFLYVEGEFPKHDVDHANMQRNDNRWINLRKATRAENRMNTLARSDSATGIKGVCWYRKLRKFVAQCSLNGKVHHLGYFCSAIDASIAYEKFVNEHYGNFFKSNNHQPKEH